MPGKAAGNITFLTVSAFVAPRANDPSLNETGTADITSSDKEDT